METKINIAEILKDKPKWTKLYSSACGDCKFEEAEDESFKISFYSPKFGFMRGGDEWFDKKGKLFDNGECVVFPSKEMRDWSKFAWKKGDVLVSEGRGNLHVIFEVFNDDTYTTFKGKHYLCNYDGNEDYNEEDYNDYNKEVNMRTIEFKKDNDDEAQSYINTIEERLGGKLNRETLEVEKTQPEFKDFDLITIKLPKGRSLIGIFKAENDENYYLHANLDSRDIFTIYEDSYCDKSTCTARLSTEEEKMHFFDVLAKKGKTWEAVKKQIVDLKSKIELKPFDKVLVRDSESDKWRANLFGYIDKDEYYHCVYANWVYCIPYAGNEHLLGTTNNSDKYDE